MFFLSVGILFYPAQNNISQNSKAMACCSTQGLCHQNLPKKNQKKSNSQTCCCPTVSVFQFIKQNETTTPLIFQKNTFKNKVSFFYTNSKLPNTPLEGIWQPPKFI